MSLTLTNPHLATDERAVADAIAASRVLLEETDEDGRPLFTVPTWERAVTLLHGLSAIAERTYGSTIDAPAFEPGPDGSVDLHWKQPGRYELLLNVPADTAARPSFYGDDIDGNVTKGTLATPGGGGMLIWLIRTR